jgi:glycosyltransferase involved in cell wall biosynthesis
MKGLKKAILSHPADLIVAASFPLKHMFVSVNAAQKSRRPVALIGAMHPLDLWGYGRSMIIRAVQSSGAYIALSTYEQDYLVEKGVSRKKISVIGVGIDPERISVLDKPQAKAALGLTGQKVVGFIGQIAHHKGVGCLVDAMKAVWRHFPDVTLLIAGARRLFASEIEAEIASWPEEWQNRVLIKYDFDEKEKPFLFNAVDVFVYPSGFESFGIAYLEAWCARNPVIGTWEGAIPSVVDAGKDGLLVNYLHRDELAEAIMTLLSHPAYAQKLGNSGYQKVLQKYTWPQVTAKYREVFSSLID